MPIKNGWSSIVVIPVQHSPDDQSLSNPQFSCGATVAEVIAMADPAG
jgi:hypothetical protein